MRTPLVINSIAQAKTLLNQEPGGISDWFVISQVDIDQFAAIIDDHQWIHIDQPRAKQDSPFGSTIAHGFLTLSQLTRMAASATDVKLGAKTFINYGFNRIRFVSPVLSGAKVRGRFALAAVKEVEGGYELVWNVTVEIEGQSKPAVVAEWLCRGYF